MALLLIESFAIAIRHPRRAHRLRVSAFATLSLIASPSILKE